MASPPIEKVYTLPSEYTYGFEVSLEDILRNLGPTVSQIADYLGLSQGQTFHFPTWVISSMISASAGFNLTIINSLTFQASLYDETFYPNTQTKLRLDINSAGGGFLSIRSWIGADFSVPYLTKEGIQKFHLYHYGENFELVREFQPEINLVYPSSDTYELLGPHYGYHYPPWDRGLYPNDKFPFSQSDYGGYVNILYHEEDPPSMMYKHCIGDPRACSVPIYGLGIGVAPTLEINGLLSGSIDEPNIQKTFVTNESSIDLDFIVPLPTNQALKVADLVPIIIHNIKYVWTPIVTFRFFIWGFVINPKALWDRDFVAPTGEPQWFVKTIDIGNVTLKLPTQTYNDEEGFTIKIPTFLMDKDPFMLDDSKMVLIIIIISAVIIWRLRR